MQASLLTIMLYYHFFFIEMGSCSVCAVNTKLALHSFCYPVWSSLPHLPSLLNCLLPQADLAEDVSTTPALFIPRHISRAGYLLSELLPPLFLTIMCFHLLLPFFSSKSFCKAIMYLLSCS
eukprot:c20729_g1_i1 orf=60-422(-)